MRNNQNNKNNEVGVPSNGMKVEFFRHDLGEEELESVKKVLQSLFLTTGERVEEFERGLAAYLNVEHAVGLTSCTGALHLALTAAGIKSGDEVITTPLSFVATANAILMAGAVPRFVDIEPETGNIDADKIEAVITKKTKAILPVHLYGQMVDLKKILAIAKRHNLKVIEDAAHALEAERYGIRPGQKTFGACFSFYATKSITSGEGGAFVTQDQAMAKVVRQLRSHGITAEAAQRHRVGLRSYDIDRLGWKYNMDNIQAALLLPQLKRIVPNWKRRSTIAEIYRREFDKAGIEMPSVNPGVTHANHLFAILVPKNTRDNLLDYLKSHGVGAAINYPPIHLFSFFRKTFGFKEGDFPIAEDFAAREISLPLYPALTLAEVKYVIKTVKDGLSRYARSGVARQK